MARVCVIGAGASGIAAIHELLNFSFDIVCYELRKEAGGAWLYDADPGDSRLAFDHHGHPVVSSSVERDAGCSPSPMYNGLRTNIPCEGMAYRRKPFPKGTARFPTQKVVLDYLQARARQVDRYIQYGVKVTRVCKEEGAKKWTVETRSMSGNEVKSEEFDHVLVANGHYSQPYIPAIPGFQSWRGEVSHSRWYRSPNAWAGKKVLVVGSSASGGDIAREVARQREKTKGDKVYQSIREVQRNGIDPRDPQAASYSKYIDVVPGLQQIEPSIDGKGNGRIVCGERVLDDVEVIVFATGYLYSFPFLSPYDSPFSSARLTREPPMPDKATLNGNGATSDETTLGGLRVHHLDAASSLFYRSDTTIAFPALFIRVIPFPLAEAQARVIARIWAGQAPSTLDLTKRPDPLPDCPASTVGEDVEEKTAHFYGGQSEFDYQDHILRLVGEGEKGAEVNEDGSFGATPMWRRELRGQNSALRLAELGY